MRTMYANRKEQFSLPEFIDTNIPVIVSLTTYKHRIKDIMPTIKSLQEQSRRPDKIVVYIAYEDENLITEKLRNAELVEIRLCEDTLSHKKFNGIFDFPDCYVVTADDDLIYFKDWLKVLLRADRIPSSVPHVSAHNTFILDGWSFGRNATRKDNSASLKGNINMYVMTGAGVLIPPGLDLHELKEAFKYSPHCDEKPLSVLLRQKNIPVCATSFNCAENHKEAYRNSISLWDMYNCKHQKERWEESKKFIEEVFKK